MPEQAQATGAKPRITVADIIANLKLLLEHARVHHREDYARCRDFYLGGDYCLRPPYLTQHPRESVDHWSERSKRLVGVNVCGVIVDKIVSAEYGFPATRSFGEQAAALQEEFDFIAPQADVHRSRVDTARNRAIDGVGIVHFYWDADAGKVCWKYEQPEHVYPIVASSVGMGDYDDIVAVVVDRSQTTASVKRAAYQWDTSFPDEGKGQYQPSRGDRAASPGASFVEREIEIYTEDEAAVVRITINKGTGDVSTASIVESSGENVVPYGCIPFVFWHNKRIIGHLFGASMLRGITEINGAINRELSNLGEIIDMQTFSLLVVQGNIQNLPVDEKGRVRLDVSERSFINLDADGQVYYADPNPKIVETISTIEKLVQWGMASGRVPLAVAMPQQEHAESGVSRQIQFLPLIDLITELETYDAQSEREFAEKALLIQRRMTGTADITLDAISGEMEAFKIAWSENFYPSDETARMEVYDRKRDLGLESRMMQLRNEYPDLDDNAIEELAQEIDDEADARAARSAESFLAAADNDDDAIGNADKGGGNRPPFKSKRK